MKNLKQISQGWWKKQTTLSADRASFEAGYTEAKQWIPITEPIEEIYKGQILIKVDSLPLVSLYEVNTPLNDQRVLRDFGITHFQYIS